MLNKIKIIYHKHQNTILIASIAILYTILLIVLSFFHENWRDEAQAWLICRDLSFLDMLKQISLEGHPFLWYIILFPFTKLGFPYHTMNIISALLIGLSIFIILKKAPFHPIVKILIMLSIPFLYQHSIIARNYALIPLIISLIAIYYPQKNTHPLLYAFLLTLLFNTHTLMLGLGILLVLEWISEFIFTSKKINKKVIIGIITAIITLVLIIAFYKYSSIHNTYYHPFKLSDIKILYILKSGFNTFSYFSNSSSPILSITNIITMVSIFLFFAYFIIYNRKIAFVYLFAILFEWFIFAYIVGPSIHRIMTIVYIVIFCSWIALQEAKNTPNKYILTVILLILFVNLSYLSIYPIKSDINKNYSSSKDVANYIKNNLHKDSKLIGTLDFKVSAVLPYLYHQKAWSPITNDYYSFITWNEERTKVLPPEKIINNIMQKFSQNKNIYYIYSGNEDETVKNYFLEHNQLKLLYKTKSSICGEIYELYQLFI